MFLVVARAAAYRSRARNHNARKDESAFRVGDRGSAIREYFPLVGRRSGVQAISLSLMVEKSATGRIQLADQDARNIVAREPD